MNRPSSSQVFTLANKITLVRILSVPVFVLVMVYYLIGTSKGEDLEYLRWVGLVVFTAAALTDALDGFVARYRHEVTRLGRMLDPIADKSLLLSAIIILTRVSPITEKLSFPIWFTLLVIARDVILIVGAFVVHAMAGGVDVYPRFAGKIATVLQMAAVIWVLSGLTHKWFYGVVIGASAFTFLAGVLYVIDGLRQIEHAHALAHQKEHGGHHA